MRLPLLLFVSLLGCSVPDVSIEGRPCPCPGGFDCSPTTNTCIASVASTVGSSSSGAVACGGVCGTPGCGACPDVVMIDAGGFEIDALEVTRADYQRFLADHVDPTGQPDVCSWNDSFDPAIDDDAGCPTPYDFANGTFAIGCVDWCDARAFCAWAGKRMCGRKGGGTVPDSGLNDATKSEWYAACSGGGETAYPYGDTYVDDACNTSGNAGEVIAVGSYPSCQGGFSGIYDMVGNAEEWEDSCELSADPASDNCKVRGGAFWADVSTPGKMFAKCESDGAPAPDRDAASHDWTIRCCRDL